MRSQNTVRTRWAALGAAVAVTLGAAGIGGYGLVSADISTGDRPVYVPITPCRLTDTRPAPDNVGPRTTKLTPDETLTITAHGTNGNCTGPSTIPTDATALALNVTALNATSQTYLTFWGDGPNPGTANLNPAPGQPPTPNAVNTPLSPAGTFNLYNERGTVNVVIDINGYYAPHDHDDRYIPIGDAYTKTESDERYGEPATEVHSSTFDMDPLPAADWARETGLVHSEGSPGCLDSPFTLPPGASVDRVSVTYEAVDEIEATLSLIGAVAEPGRYGDGEFVHLLAPPGADAPLPGSGDTDDLVLLAANAELSDDTVVRSGFDYAIRFCTSDSVQVYGMDVIVSR